MDNKTIITIVSVVLGIGLIYLIYKALGGSKGAKKDALDKQKAAAKARDAAKADPKNKVLADAALQAGQAAYDAIFKSKGGKNADGSTPKQGTSKNGLPMTTVDAAGDYIENDDPTTLYNSNGDAIGDLDAESGFYLDANGRKIAASDGSPVTNTDSYGNYQDDNGDWYSYDGTPITIFANGIYVELDNSSDVFDMSGDVVGKQNGDGSYSKSSDGMDYVLATGRVLGISSQISSYNSDGSVDYVDGVTLSADQMTLEQSDGTPIATGGQKILWYDTDTEDIHYA